VARTPATGFTELRDYVVLVDLCGRQRASTGGTRTACPSV